MVLKDRGMPVFMAAPCATAKTRMKPKWVRTGDGTQDGALAHGEAPLSHEEGGVAPRPAARKEGESLTPSEVRQRETSSVGYLLEVDAKKGYK